MRSLSAPSYPASSTTSVCTFASPRRARLPPAPSGIAVATLFTDAERYKVGDDKRQSQRLQRWGAAFAAQMAEEQVSRMRLVK
jgi:hypothetical protein